MSGSGSALDLFFYRWHLAFREKNGGLLGETSPDVATCNGFFFRLTEGKVRSDQ